MLSTKYNNKSFNAFVRDYMYDYVKETSKLYDEKMKKSRKDFEKDKI